MQLARRVFGRPIVLFVKAIPANLCLDSGAPIIRDFGRRRGNPEGFEGGIRCPSRSPAPFETAVVPFAIVAEVAFAARSAAHREGGGPWPGFPITLTVTDSTFHRPSFFDNTYVIIY